ncbi:MerR-like DNA binding protein [Mobilisporobacter senegalensis]|uniref:MerR-like DNA binding protein n=1 Tax=Mobilisporobacter senegalensis TaxID=1329262 RepID=A0A3N1Y3G5_9FIRM|nr:helix-turn-helix domain-containing protein [Mobilisporobacter senegalensis]ROR31817.1 MerR-like DNA binding protein [Mobilisporobacter senegalensis]
MSRQRSLEAILSSEYVTIGELVRITETRYSTLKYYTEEGMIPFEQEEEKLTRRYKRDITIKQIERIKKLKKFGLSIDELKKELKENPNEL